MQFKDAVCNEVVLKQIIPSCVVAWENPSYGELYRTSLSVFYMHLNHKESPLSFESLVTKISNCSFKFP